MSYISEESHEVRDLSDSEIELIGGGFSPSIIAAIKEHMGFAATIAAVAKKVLDKHQQCQ